MEAGPEATPELRQALRDYYLRSLTGELGLADARARALLPKIDALLDAQRDGLRTRADVGVRLMRAARLDLSVTGAERAEAAAAVDAALRAEAEELARIRDARSAVVAELEPRQAARFLAFEGRFQERVRRLIREGPPGPAGGSPGATDRPEPDRGGEGGAPPPDGGPAFGEIERPEPPPGGAPMARPEPGIGGRPGDEARRTAMLVFTHELRRQLELSDDATLLLLPKVEALFETRLRGERQRKLLHERLLEAADDPDRGVTDLRALVDEALRHDEDVPKRITAARAAITGSLAPVQAARFLLAEHRAEREMREQVRRVREGWNGEGRRPEGGGMRRPGGGGAMRPGGAMPPGGGPRRPGGGGPRPGGG